MASLVVLFVVLAIAIAVGTWYLREQRRKEIAAVAARLGFRYSREDPFGLVDLPFALFGRGDGRGCENVLWGSASGRDVRLFDYWYFDESTDAEGHTSRTYHRFSCALTQIDALCPHLSVRREGFFSRLADHVGLRDIEFESDEFNRTYQVESEDRKFAFALLDARMMEWLLGTDGWSFEVHGSLALCAIHRLRPRELPMAIEALAGFCEHVPPVVASMYPARKDA